jgi:protein tyrosine/serine phosphatase
MLKYVCVAALLATPVLADDYTAITDAAYSAGVVAGNMNLSKRDFGTFSPVQNDQQHLARLTAVVEGAIKLQKIDSETANKLTAVGQQDARLCWESSKKCMLDHFHRLEDKNYDQEKSQRIYQNCLDPAEPVCKRVAACD